jgi:hypothetical protein
MPKTYVHITLPDGSEEQRGSLTRNYTHCVYTPGLRVSDALVRVNTKFKNAQEMKARRERKFEAIASYQLGNKDALDFTEKENLYGELYGLDGKSLVVEVALAYDGRDKFDDRIADEDHIGCYRSQTGTLEDFLEREKASLTWHQNTDITTMDNCKSAYDILMAGDAEVVGRDTYPGLPREFNYLYPMVIGWSQSEKNAYKRRDTEARHIGWNRSVWVMPTKPGKAKAKVKV